MLIAVYTFKGGEGKTHIGTNLALTLNCALVTNDVYSPLENIFSDDMLLKISPGDDIPDFSDFAGSKTDHVIFDLGGYPDTRLVNIITQCAYVIVPLTNETYNLDIGVNSINEIAALNQNIVIVANKTTKDDFVAIEQQVRRFFTYPMFNIKKSSVMQKMML